MQDFIYCAPTRVIFGKDTELQVGKILKEAGATCVLLQYGGGSIKKSGLYDRVVQAVREAGIELYEIGGVQPNPHLSLVREAIALAREKKVDYLLAVGGGSAIDSTKATAVGVPYEGDVWDFYCGKATPKTALPLGVILTIPAAGSEGSNSSVITNEDGWIKRGYSSDLCRPVFAVMNPELTLTLPDYQTSCGCTDILMHTMERYFTNGGSMEITDSMAEALMRTVIAKAKILHADPQNLDARAEVMWAGSLSHNGLTGCGNDGGDWATHMLEHEIGGMFDVAHGAGLAAIWGSWARYVMDSCLSRFVRFAVNVMGIESSSDERAVALAGIQAMEAFFAEIGMPTRIPGLGIAPTHEQLEQMAKSCAAACGGVKGSARPLREADMLAIYEMAMEA